MHTAYMLFELLRRPTSLFFFFFNDTATTEIYTLSLHDALPICRDYVYLDDKVRQHVFGPGAFARLYPVRFLDRKSTRLNSSHLGISYAVFCLKKKKKFSKRAAPT